MRKFLVLLLAVAPAISWAGEMVVLTPAAEKSGARIALDLVAEKPYAGFEFVVNVPAGAKVDTSRCASDLPKGLDGACLYRAESNSVKFVVFMPAAGEMPVGRVAVGSLGVFAKGMNSADLTVTSVRFSDGLGVMRDASSVVAK